MNDPDITDRLQRDGIEASHRFIDASEVMTTGHRPPRTKAGKGQSSNATDSFPFSTFDEASAGPVAKPWLLKGLLARGETSAWIGAPGSLKSALLTDIAVCIAANRDWHEQRSKQATAVIYFALERADLVRRRLAAYRVRDGFKSLPVAVVSKLVNLMDAATVETVVATIDAVERHFGLPVGLLIFDTYAKAMSAGGGDEDKARDQNLMFANIQRMKERRAVHVALVGHTGKDANRGARGSNAILGDVDLMVAITGTDIRTATITKANDLPEGPIASFRAEMVELGLDEDGENRLSGRLDGVDASSMRHCPKNSQSAPSAGPAHSGQSIV
jgi:AAA domain